MRNILLAIACVVGFAPPIDAATLYAKATGGNWSAATTWSNVDSAGVDDSGPPTSADTVILEAGSGNVVLDATGLSAKTVSMVGGTGDYAGTLSAANSGAGISLNLYLNTTGTVWEASSASVFDIGTTLIATATLNGSTTVTFKGGGKTYGRLSTAASGASTFALTGSNTFLGRVSAGSFPSTTGVIFQFEAGTTTTFEDIFVFYVPNPVTFASSSAGMAAIFAKSSGVINISGVVVTDIAATGGSSWCDSEAGGDGGGNTGWTWEACPLAPQQLMLGVGD